MSNTDQDKLQAVVEYLEERVAEAHAEVLKYLDAKQQREREDVTNGHHRLPSAPLLLDPFFGPLGDPMERRLAEAEGRHATIKSELNGAKQKLSKLKREAEDEAIRQEGYDPVQFRHTEASIRHRVKGLSDDEVRDLAKRQIDAENTSGS